MSSDDIAIKVNNVGKCYEMYGKPSHRLWQTLTMGRKTFYKEFWALRDINFEVKRGECVGIIGRNGSGKSTLLQIIAGTLTPTTGNAEVKGRVAALLELGSGFNPEFTGHENVYMNASILGLTKTEIDAKYDAIVTFADIGDFIDQPVKTYSSGMMVRLAFAVQVMVEPDILIVDEALTVGDIRFQLKCFDHIEKLKTNGTTIVFVSHSSDDVVRLCQTVYWLDKGIVRKCGTAKEVVEEYHAFMVHNTTAIKEVPSSTTKGMPDEHDLLAPIPNNAIANGEGGAQIESIGFFNANDESISILYSPQHVRITFKMKVKERLETPYVGFQIVNRIGIRIMGSNNHVLKEDLPLMDAGSTYLIHFKFPFPEIENGEYLIAAGVSDGTIEHHVRHHFVADAYHFTFHSASLYQRQLVLLKLPECQMTTGVAN